jgi:uncharacterized RDD family membrane protein YckC
VTTPSGYTSPGWYADPSGRYELRFWDGAAWTIQVSNRGVLGYDSPAVPSAPAAPPPPYGAGPASSTWTSSQATIAPPPPGLPAWTAEPHWNGAAVLGAHAPSGYAPPLATQGQRFGGYLLDGLLALVTLGIGWLIWCCFTFSRGQTPAKSMMGLRVVKQDTGLAATWGEMFLRNVLVQIGIGILSALLFGIPTIVAACMIFGGTLNQTGWDRIMGTVVVVDHAGVTVPPGR